MGKCFLAGQAGLTAKRVPRWAKEPSQTGAVFAAPCGGENSIYYYRFCASSIVAGHQPDSGSLVKYALLPLVPRCQGVKQIRRRFLAGISAVSRPRLALVP